MIKKKKSNKKEHSKIVATIIVMVALIDVQLCILSTFLEKEIPTEIAVSLIVEIIGVYLTYCVKAHFGKKEEEKTRLIESGIKDISNIKEF